MSKLWLSSLAASVLSHVALSMVLAEAPPAPEPRLPPTVMLDVMSPEPERPPPEMAPLPSPALARTMESRAPAPAPMPAPAPEPAPESPPPEPVAPVDLTGVTLSSDEGSFSVPASNGQARRAPLAGMQLGQRTGKPAPPRGRADSRPERRVAPRWVALRDLSARPRPPSLDGALRANYPAGARAQGIGGSATVRARISAAGLAGAVRVASESFPGFGQACRRTLLGSRWTPPLDADGHAVATEIVYRCRFVVDP
ncbi:MAG: energy transducer TonB [Myxococcales bacterium]|nr:energy transducer TonB [Myxococcales bacterium]